MSRIRFPRSAVLLVVLEMTIPVGTVEPQTNRERMKAANEKKKADAESKKKAAADLGRGQAADNGGAKEEKEAEAPARPIARPAPGVEQFKGIVVLDTQSKQNDFDLLTNEEREELLAVAANIAGLPGAPRIENNERETALSNLLNQEKASRWLASLAEREGGREFAALLGVPAPDSQGILVRFALRNLPEQIEAKKLAQSIKNRGLSGLEDYEKKRVRADKALFAIE
jgi:hypothetical protein